MTSGLTAFALADGPHLIYVDAKQHVNQMAYDGSSWYNQDLTVLAGSSTLAAPATGAARYLASDGARFYYIDTSQHINEMGYHGSNGWVNFDITALSETGAVAAPGTGLAVYLAGDGPRVYYIDTNEHINELGYHGSDDWVNFDITALSETGAVAAPGSGLAVYLASDGPRVYYADTNQHINEMGYHGANDWVNFDITALSETGAIAAPGCGLAVYLASDGPRVYYADTNRHINEIGYHGANDWVNFDVTALAGTGALASPTSEVAIYLASDGPRIYYTDANQHINEMGYHGANDWVNFDVTALAGTVSLATPGTSLTLIPLNDGQRVAYVDTSEHLNQIAYSGTWYDQDLTAFSNGPLVSVLLTVSGQVTAGGSGFSGVTVSLSGTTAASTSVARSTTADSNGNYSFAVPVGGSYTVTPSLAGYSFSPGSTDFANLVTSQTVDFEASAGSGANGSASSVNGFYGLYTPRYTTPSGNGCGDISGSWVETDAYGSSTWNLQQNGGTASGTVKFSDGPSCGTITYQTVNGQLNNGVFSLIASNPSALTDSCGYSIAPTEQQQVALSGGSCSQGSASWSSEFGAGTSTWAGQIPGSLRVVSSRALTPAENQLHGCMSSWVGYYIMITYQVLDQSGTPIKAAGLVPQEQILNYVFKIAGQKFGPKDLQTQFADITPGMTTDANGIFVDGPFGECGSGTLPVSASETQNIKIVNPKNRGASGVIRSNKWRYNVSASNSGTVTNDADVTITQ